MGILIRLLKQFIHDTRSIGIVLLACTAISLLLANWHYTSEAYIHFFVKSFNASEAHHLHIGFLSLPNSPLLVINDLFMAIFFFLAGMEIKRELLQGELSSFKRSLLPVIAAAGGMLVPALLFLLLNHDTHYAAGWAIPTATDIAFTLGIISLLGSRVPASLKIFLTALAIIDDLGAIIVIALFYGGDIQVAYLLGCVVVIAALVILNKYKVKAGILYWFLGLLLWYCMFNSGIHATIAGVLFAFCIPVKQLKNIETQLHAPVYFLAVPIFALANTAIVLPANSLQALTGTVSWGILLGLCIGKPMGICITAYTLIRSKLAHLPTGVNGKQLIGAGMLAGIGFTMSIFISTLAFESQGEQDIAKISVLLASFIAMIVGYVWLRVVTSPPPPAHSSNTP